MIFGYSFYSSFRWFLANIYRFCLYHPLTSRSLYKFKFKIWTRRVFAALLLEMQVMISERVFHTFNVYVYWSFVGLCLVEFCLPPIYFLYVSSALKTFYSIVYIRMNLTTLDYECSSGLLDSGYISLIQYPFSWKN